MMFLFVADPLRDPQFQPKPVVPRLANLLRTWNNLPRKLLHFAAGLHRTPQRNLQAPNLMTISYV